MTSINLILSILYKWVGRMVELEKNAFVVDSWQKEDLEPGRSFDSF